MELWAARESDGRACFYVDEPVLDSDSNWGSSGDGDGLVSYDDAFSDLACRDVKPGEKRKLKVFDPINEIVEYEDTLEERHQRLAGAVQSWAVNKLTSSTYDSSFIDFLRTEGYIN